MRSFTRFVFLSHRYAGIGIGLLMAAWCLSGVVMMYVSFPELTQDERLAGLSPVDMGQCCTFPGGLAEPDAPVTGLRIENVAGSPILHLSVGGLRPVINLATGASWGPVTPETARRSAADFAGNRGVEGDIARIERIERDQWTVSSSFNAHRPLYKVSFDDAAGTVLYVSGTSGAVVQDTVARERFWNWCGAVVHWLYPTMLRQHVAAWSQTVIWTSILGAFLTLTGLYAGIRQYGRGKAGSISPYKGFSFWHHVGGLVFGIFTLLWVVSGLFSMQPWGLMEGSGAGLERARLQGLPPHYADMRQAIEALPQSDWAKGLKSLDAANLDGMAYVMATMADGDVHRIDAATLEERPITEADMLAAASRLRTDAALQSVDYLTEDDAYYFSHHEKAPLPVVRVIFGDEQATRYYLDPQSARLVAKVDRAGRYFRWLHLGLHRFDFTALLRSRPLWDILVVSLMLGVSALCLTGCWMGYRRLAGKQKKPKPQK